MDTNEREGGASTDERATGTLPVSHGRDANAMSGATGASDENRNEMSTYDRWPCKRGQSQIELLVVMIYIMLLQLAMLPELKRYTIQTQYKDEAIPALGNFRTRIELYRLEFERLPGLGLPSAAVPGGTSQMAPDLSKAQTVAGAHASCAADFNRKVEMTGTNHLLSQIGASLCDLTGRRLRPQHFQYRVDACESNGYFYAIGVFGDGDRLKAGTGYAVLEWHSPGVGERKREVAVWKRYRAAAKSPRQVVMVSASEARAFFGCETVKQSLEKGLCWIGDPGALLSQDAAVREMAKAALHEAGWELDGFPPIPWYRKRGRIVSSIPVLLWYALLVLGLGLGTFADMRFHWEWGIGLVIWLAALSVTLPMSPLGPTVCLLCIGLVLVTGLCFWSRLVKGFHWIVRLFRREEVP